MDKNSLILRKKGNVLYCRSKPLLRRFVSWRRFKVKISMIYNLIKIAQCTFIIQENIHSVAMMAEKSREEVKATATKKSLQPQITSQNQIVALRFTQMSPTPFISFMNCAAAKTNWCSPMTTFKFCGWGRFIGKSAHYSCFCIQ